jgi:crotonobetaine/carnitine-CoA ligase
MGLAIETMVRLPDVHPFVRLDTAWLLRQACADHGERTFLVWEPFEGEPRRWTYAQARADIRRIAAGLKARGVGPRDAVILHLENSPESVFAWLACGEIGAVGVTTNARCAGEELAYFVEKTRAVGIITQPPFEDLARRHAPVGWSVIAPPGEGAARIGADGDPGEGLGDPSAPFSVQFTSGTTARPKGVIWTHANALWGAMVNARHLGLRTDDVSHVIYPLFHTVAQAWQVLASMWVGAGVVVQPKFSASRYWDVVMRNGCTWGTAGPFMRQALGDQPTPDHRLRFLLAGANARPTNSGWGARGVVGHGMTELITQSIYCDPTGPLDEGTIGRPAPEYQLSIRAADGAPTPIGEAGELHVKGVRGLSVFAEYLDDPGATAAAFTEDGFFRTGDLVEMRPDGAMRFLDRIKDMLKVGGENVAASEIEAVARRVAGVRDVAVVGRPDPMLSETPFAFVIPAPDAPADLAERITAACRQALADFKVPRGVRLVDEFPRGLNDKILKAQLRQQLREEQAP